MGVAKYFFGINLHRLRLKFRLTPLPDRTRASSHAAERARVASPPPPRLTAAPVLAQFERGAGLPRGSIARDVDGCFLRIGAPPEDPDADPGPGVVAAGRPRDPHRRRRSQSL